MNKKGNLSIDSENIFPIIKKWLYSDQDIYIRELAATEDEKYILSCLTEKKPIEDRK